jgi:hypothetical protein
MGRVCSTHGEVGEYVYDLSGEPRERERALGRPRRRWEDNIKMHLSEIGWASIYWIYLAQDRGQWRVLVNTLMNFRVP